VREQWITTRIARINTLRGILREHGLLLSAGAQTALAAVPAILDHADTPLPMHLRTILASVHAEIRAMEGRAADLERELHALAEADPVVTRLRTIPSIGLDGDRPRGRRCPHPCVSPRAPVFEVARPDAPRALEWAAPPSRVH
jgi:hypothetical protein